jgi:DNA-binding GntR family transcriptional regulator
VLHPRGYEQHKRLLELFEAGDFKAFEALMREHVMGTRDSYVASLKARNDATAATAAR